LWAICILYYMYFQLDLGSEQPNEQLFYCCNSIFFFRDIKKIQNVSGSQLVNVLVRNINAGAGWFLGDNFSYFSAVVFKKIPKYTIIDK